MSEDQQGPKGPAETRRGRCCAALSLIFYSLLAVDLLPHPEKEGVGGGFGWPIGRLLLHMLT